MAWICPTFNRPGRLAHLAMSWDKYQSGKKLFVRVWEHDPSKDEYFRADWPDGWELYISSTRYAANGIQEFYERHPQEPSYGFIGDDVVLRTHNGLEQLERACQPYYLSYPSDTIHRHALCTHFCVSGALAKMVGFLAPPQLQQCYFDVVWMSIVQNVGLQRYCPNVVFDHLHFLNGRAPHDNTYQQIYPTTEKMGGEPHASDEKWMKEHFSEFLEEKVKELRYFFIDSFEDELKFRREDEYWAGNHAELEIPVRGR